MTKCPKNIQHAGIIEVIPFKCLRFILIPGSIRSLTIRNPYCSTAEEQKNNQTPVRNKMTANNMYLRQKEENNSAFVQYIRAIDGTVKD